MLTVGVLGPVEARRDGVRLPVPAGRTTELLARLALDAGVWVRTDVLVEDLWGGLTSRNTLQSKVSQLRHAIGREVVVGSGRGYLLALTPDAVDATQLAALATASAAARAADDPATSLARATAGLALVRGDVLAEVGDWALPTRARLEELRLDLVEDAAVARLDLGAGHELVAELEGLVATYPLRESLWAALITALYRAGRQADARAAYGRVRRLLVAELGVEPGPALRDLERQVLRQTPALPVARGPALARPGNVPPADASVVGREGDVDEVLAALAAHRVVTVLGPGGVGKTRLAMAVADRIEPPGGVWLVRLEAVDAGGDAPLAQLVAETLHVPGGGPALPERLAGSETVLLLDGCEHLVTAAARLVSDLLALAPRLRVLATSQAPLGLPGEQRHPLAPLTQDQSVVLFGQRARAVRRQLVLDDQTRPVVEQVCRGLDGLPLAIELAAVRVRSLSVREIARRLDDRFRLLRDPSSAEPERHRALAGAIGWSYELLYPDDQRALWALSCFAGSASLAAVEHVLAALGVPAEAVLDAISRLVDRSLVSVEAVEGDELRYRLLDSIRRFAADRLRESGQAERAVAAYAEWYVQTAQWCERHVRGDRQATCVDIARAERTNLDAVLSWCTEHDRASGLRVATGFGWTWVVLGDGTAGAARVRSALVDEAPPHDRALALLLIAWLEASAGDVALAQAELDHARRLAGALGEPGLLADVERHQAFVAIQQGRAAAVHAAASASLAHYRAHDLTWSIAASLLLGAYGSLMTGDTISATRDATEAVDLLTRLGDAWGLVHGYGLLGGIAQAEHRFDDAADALERAARESDALRFRGQAALHRTNLARVRHRAGDAGAATAYRRALDDALACGDGRLAATARVHLARLLRSLGHPDVAVGLLVENQRWYAAAGGGDYALLTRCLLEALRDDADALTTTLDQARAEGEVEVQVQAQDALARLALERGDRTAARALLGAADALAPAVAHVLDEADRADAHPVRTALL